ncbi:MAG TPA: hypothetical protein VK204_13710 [Nocardioidaceae bacterium]|nr:hypothetical protein [Nocardioidaceae bacterium]
MQLSEFAGFDLDRNTARAWSRFQARLADRLAEMGEDDMLVIDAEVADDDIDGAAPYVQFAGFGEGSMVRGEVSSNNYLAEPYALDEDRVARLTALGWHLPTVGPGQPEGDGSGNFFTDLPLAEADRLAVMAVKALREVFGVAHPAFLVADGLGEDPEAPLPPSDAVPVERDEPLAIMPESAEHLRELVDEALTPLFGAAPQHDDDGDIPVPWGSSLVFVRVDDEVPVVQLFGFVVEGVKDLERAAFEVSVLNRDFRFIKFLLVEDRVMARVHLPAWPFVPEHLRSMLTGMSAQLDQIDEDLVARVGGTRAFESSDDGEEGTPPVPVAQVGAGSDETVLKTLLQLDVDAAGTVDPELAAGVCRFDQELIVRLLGETERQEISWRQARDNALLAGDGEEAGACDHEMEAWERTSALLRRALRLVVERALGREASAGSSYSPSPDAPASPPAHAARRRRPPRPRRARFIVDLDDLLRVHDVDDLDELDDRLTQDSPYGVNVLDLDEGIEVLVAGESGELEYPFTLADLQGLIEGLEELADSSSFDEEDE